MSGIMKRGNGYFGDFTFNGKRDKMNKWITLHWLNGEQVLVNPAKGFLITKEWTVSDKDEMEEHSNIRLLSENAWTFKESPAEILAILNKPDTELRQIARELLNVFSEYTPDKFGKDLWTARHKLEALLEKP